LRSKYDHGIASLRVIGTFLSCSFGDVDSVDSIANILPSSISINSTSEIGESRRDGFGLEVQSCSISSLFWDLVVK
jgi:hypothetical protein